MNGPFIMLMSAAEAKDIVQAGISEGGGDTHRTLQVIAERTFAFMRQHGDRFIWDTDRPEGPLPTCECLFAMLGTIFCTWAFWVLESKGIEHYGAPNTGWRSFMEHRLGPTLDALFRDARNLAREEKQEAIDRGDIPSSTMVPALYHDWRTVIS